MKKLVLFIVSLLLLFSTSVYAETWHTANQKLVGWDVADGSAVTPAIPQAQIGYHVYLANALTDPNKTNPVKIGATKETQFLITLNTPGKFWVGVSSTNTVDNEVVGESDVAWSNVPADVAGVEIWGLQYFPAPPKVGGLVIK